MTCGLGAGAQEASAIDIAKAAMFLFGDVILSLPLFHPFTRSSWLGLCSRAMLPKSEQTGGTWCTFPPFYT